VLASDNLVQLWACLNAKQHCLVENVASSILDVFAPALGNSATNENDHA